MRKGLIYSILLASALLIPREDVELAKIKPVETVSIRYEDERIVIETDTEDTGMGSTTDDAIKDLMETADGRVYLDTAKYLLVGADAEVEIPKLSGMLKGSVRICERKGEIDVVTVGEYLRAHKPDMRLKDWREGEQLQVLESENERMKIK